jgi:hypothetical protein
MSELSGSQSPAHPAVPVHARPSAQTAVHVAPIVCVPPRAAGAPRASRAVAATTHPIAIPAHIPSSALVPCQRNLFMTTTFRQGLQACCVQSVKAVLSHAAHMVMVAVPGSQPLMHPTVPTHDIPCAQCSSITDGGVAARVCGTLCAIWLALADPGPRVIAVFISGPLLPPLTGSV